MGIIFAAMHILADLHGHPVFGDGLRKIERAALKAIIRHLSTGHANFKSRSGGRVS